VNKPLSARLLARPGEALEIVANGEAGFKVRLPEAAPDPVASVVAVEVDGAPETRLVPIRPGGDGVLLLDAREATLEGHTLQLEMKHAEPNAGFWSKRDERISFPVEFPKAGPHAAVLRWSCDPASAGGRLEIRLHDPAGNVVSSLPLTVESTGGWENFRTQPAGVLAVPAAGTYTLRLVPVEIKGNGLLNFAHLRLQPAG
jgi:hypothetical protein